MLRYSLDSYRTVLLLIILDYVVVSSLTYGGWASTIIVLLLGFTLLFALRTSRAPRFWIVLTEVYVAAITLITLIAIFLPSAQGISQRSPIIGGLLLIVTPIVIGRRIGADSVVSTETVLGAVCVYLLLGFSLAYIFSAIAAITTAPFFAGQARSTPNDFLFFSYSTLTTVGYGNLVPAGNVGQMFAMLEALTGQIYLVIVVARLVSLWGQRRPTPPPPQRSHSSSPTSGPVMDSLHNPSDVDVDEGAKRLQSP